MKSNIKRIKRIQVLTTEKQHSMLKKLALKEKTSMSSLILQYIAEKFSTTE